VEIDDALISGVTRIANSDRLIKRLEPNVCYHNKLNGSEVKRVLYSLALLVKEWEKRTNHKKYRKEV